MSRGTFYPWIKSLGGHIGEGTFYLTTPYYGSPFLKNGRQTSIEWTLNGTDSSVPIPCLFRAHSVIYTDRSISFSGTDVCIIANMY